MNPSAQKVSAKHLLSVTPDPQWRYSYTWLFFLLFLALLVLFANRLNPNFLGVFRLWAMERAAPVVRVVSVPIRYVSETVDNVSRLMSADEEIAQLQQQLTQLQQQQVAMTAVLSENQQLRKELQLIDQLLITRAKAVTAKVFTDLSGYFRHSVVVTAGTEHGVSVNAPVISADNLVGKVTHASNGLSQVILLQDLNSHIPVMVLPSRARAILTGNNSKTMTLRYIQNIEAVEPGMVVVTSGDEGILPRGIVAGVISSVNPDQSRVTVVPRINSASLEYVQILLLETLADASD